MSKENTYLDDELDKAKALLIFKESDAGANALESFIKAKERLVELIINSYRTLTHVELVVKIAELESIQDIITSIQEAEEKVKILEEEINNNK